MLFENVVIILTGPYTFEWQLVPRNYKQPYQPLPRHSRADIERNLVGKHPTLEATGLFNVSFPYRRIPHTPT